MSAYAMAGVAFATLFVTQRDPRYGWKTLLATSAALAFTAGTAALATWRMERRAPLWLVACGVAGAVFTLSVPTAWPRWVTTPEMWRTAIAGALLFLVFLGVVAIYVHRVLRDRR